MKESLSSRFELVAPLTDAGLGEPWSAVDLSANRRQALVKLLPARPSAEAWSFVVARLQSLGNPRLPKVVDGAELPDGRRWIAFETVRGRSLTNWLDGHREAGTSPGLGVLQRVFDAVSNALQVGHVSKPKAVIHRGLSPASVMIEASPGGHIVTLLDHELAAFVDADALWPYLAPEQHGTRAQESAASDVFSLAVIFVELLTMRATPRADSAETWWQLAQRAPRDVKSTLAALRSDVPKGLWDVIGEALQLDAKKRPRDAQTFASAVRHQSPPAWKRLPMVEREPPAPARARQSAAAPRAEKRAANVPDGWMVAERRAEAPRTDPPVPNASPVKAAAWGRALVAVPSSPPSPVAAAARVSSAPAEVSTAPIALPSRGDDLGATTLLDEDAPPIAAPAHYDGTSTLLDDDAAPEQSSPSGGARANADYDDEESTSAMAGGGMRLRDAAKLMLARSASSQSTPGASRTGSQTLPIEQAAEVLGHASEADSRDARGAREPATRRIPLPVGPGVGATAMAPTIVPGSVTSGLAGAPAARADRIGAQTIGIEELDALGAPQTLDLSVGLGAKRDAPSGPLSSPATLPISPQLKAAPLAPLSPLASASRPPLAPPPRVAPTLPVGTKVATPAETQAIPMAVWIAVAIAAMLVIAAVVIVAVRGS